jgi:outer membrane protein assembly factor BamD (BamD/ComL family)
MSSITSLTSATSSAGLNQLMQDFQTVTSALQKGDLSTAKTAAAALQKDFQASPLAASLGKNSPVGKDFQTMLASLQAGDYSSAEKAFASLEADFKNGGSPLGSKATLQSLTGGILSAAA